MPSQRSFCIALVCRSLALIGLTLFPIATARSGDQKFLTDTNLFGMDIRDFDLPEEDPRLCYDACVADKRCHSFTYLRPHGWPGAGATAHCWIKYGTPTDVRHENCCVSGIVRPGEDAPPLPPPPPPKPPEPKPLPPPVRASEVKLDASPTTYHGACPTSIEYRGVIAAPERGTVTYRFTSGDNSGAVQQLVFKSAGKKAIRLTMQVGTPGQREDFKEKLEILGHVYCVRGPCPTWITEASAEAVTTLDCYPNPPSEQTPKTPDQK